MLGLILASTDINGNTSFTTTLPVAFSEQLITATATDSINFSTSEFGEGIVVDTAKVDLLLVPTGKSLEKDPPLPPDSNNVDHYKCYGITVAKAPKGGEPFPKFTPFDVKLEDQFGPMTVTVTKPTLLCNPVKKERDGEGAEEIKNPANHLVCYQITRSKAVPSQSPFKRIRVFLRNQFGPEVLNARAMGGLCAPSLKDPLP